VGKASFTNITMVFGFQWTKLFWSRSPKLLNVEAGAKKFRCLRLEPESEIWIPAPQPWYRAWTSMWNRHYQCYKFAMAKSIKCNLM